MSNYNYKEIKVSIVTPSFNQADFIERTILSVLNQSYKNIEYIIIDGGSTDRTMEIVDKYRDSIAIVVHEKDNGQSDAINKGFRLASGELVGWLNSDDVLYKDCIKNIVSVYNKNPDGAVYYPATLDYIDDKDNFLWNRTSKIPNRDYLLNIDYDVIQQGSFYSNEILKKINYVDPEIYYCMDLDLWLRLLEYGNIYYFDGPAQSAIRRWEETKTNLSGAKFVENIRTVINKHGAKPISRAQFKIRYIKLRILGGKIKRLIFKKGSIR